MSMQHCLAVAAFVTCAAVPRNGFAQQLPSEVPASVPQYVPPAYVPPAYLPPAYVSPPPAPVESARATHWYGWQTLALDGTALGFLVIAGGSGKEPVVSIGIGAGLATYAVGPPVVHWLHGRIGTGLLSLGLRVGLPALGAAILSAEPCIGGGSECSGDYLVALVFFTAAVPIDAAVLAREPAQQQIQSSLTPFIAPLPSLPSRETRFGRSRSGAIAGLSGRF